MINTVLKSVDNVEKSIIISQLPDDLRNLRQLAHQSGKTKAFQLMQVCYEKIVEKQPADLHSKAMLGLSYRALGAEKL